MSFSVGLHNWKQNNKITAYESLNNLDKSKSLSWFDDISSMNKLKRVSTKTQYFFFLFWNYNSFFFFICFFWFCNKSLFGNFESRFVWIKTIESGNGLKKEKNKNFCKDICYWITNSSSTLLTPKSKTYTPLSQEVKAVRQWNLVR